MTARFLGTVDLTFIESVFDQLDAEPFFIKDALLRYVACNEAMLRLCGLRNRNELIGRTSSYVFPKTLSDNFERLDRQILETGRPMIDRVILAVSRRGQANWLLFSRVPVRDAKDRVVGVVGISRRLGPSDRHDPIYQRLSLVVDEVHRNASKPLALPKLAKLAGVSISQLERDFRRLFGLSLRDYHARIRVERAASLLAGKKSIAAIAQACGYADHSAFTRRFRQAVGQTPSEFRANLQT